MRIILLALWLGLTHDVAQGCALSTAEMAQAPKNYAKIYRQTQVHTLRALRARDPRLVRLDTVEVKTVGLVMKRVVPRLFFRGSHEHWNTFIDYSIINGSLEFLVRVDEPLRDAGLFKLLLTHVLRDNPGVYAFDNYLGHTNTANLICALTGSRSPEATKVCGKLFQADKVFADKRSNELIAELETMGEADLVRFRGRILEAFHRHSPAGRVNLDVGFGRVTNIDVTFEPVKAQLGFNVTNVLGGLAQHDEISIRLIDVRHLRNHIRKLSTDGVYTDKRE